MITFAKTSAVVPFEELLTKMMPHFDFFAKKVMRFSDDNYDECIQDLSCIALDMYHSLMRRGKEVFYTPIMKFAIKRYKDGRHFMGSDTVDLLSGRTRIFGRSNVRSLSRFNLCNDSLHFLVNRKTNVSRFVQFKIDFFETWLQQQPPRDKEIIYDLMMGETTNGVAKKYGVSAGLISQYRRRYADSWYAFINPPKEETDLIDELKELAEKESE